MATTGDETMAPTPEATLADEQRRRIPAATAAFAAGILTLGGGAVTAAVLSGKPPVHVLGAMREQLATNPPQPGLKARQVLWVDDNAIQLIGLGVMLALAAAAIGLTLAHLYWSVKARRPDLPRAVLIAAGAGAGLIAISSVVQAIGSTVAAGSFADSSQQTAEAARDALAPPAVLAAGLMQLVGVFMLGISFVLLALNAMRVGLLTRFLGVLGIIVGVLFIVPLGASLPIVQSFWLAALGAMFLGFWPAGLPPAWVTGEAQPWPTQQELREARMGSKPDADGPERPSRRAARRERAEPPETPAPELPARKPHPSSKKRKRKRR